MAFEMIDREVGFAETDRETFGDGRADHERTGQARSGGRGECIDIDEVDLGRPDGPLEQPRRVHEVIARGDFWNHAAVFFMLGYL